MGNSNDKTNFPQKLLLPDTQVSMICKAFAKGSLSNIKFSKTQLTNMIQSGFSIMEVKNPIRVVDKIVNKAEDLFNKKESLNDAIKTVNISRKFLERIFFKKKLKQE